MDSPTSGSTAQLTSTAPSASDGATNSRATWRPGRLVRCAGLAAALFGGLHAANPPQATFGITTLTPPRLDLNPHPGYWPRHRLWQGIPGIERAPGGRLWATWYAGPLQEGRGQNYQLLVTSDNDGRTWSKPVAVFDPTRQLLGGDGSDPHLWLDPNGRLWWFVHRVMPSPGLHPRSCWGFFTDEPDAVRPQWRGPVFAGHGNSLNKETVLADGTWLHMGDPLGRGEKPAAPEVATGAHLYRFEGYDKPWVHHGHATFKDSPGPGTEHMVVERRDGSLWMLARIPKGIAQAFSTDKGRTWREIEPFTHAFGLGTRFFFRRLLSGSLLLVVNDHPKARANMTAMLSPDEGRTWPFKLVIDERQAVSYPDGTQDPAGAIYITYDRGRYNFDEQEILFAKITEADIRAGKLVSPQSRLKQVINKLRDDGGGVRFTGEAAEMVKEFQRLSTGNAAASRPTP